MQKQQESVQVIVCTYDMLIVFSVLYIISIAIDYMHHLCFLCMLNYPVGYSLSERESGNYPVVYSLSEREW